MQGGRGKVKRVNDATDANEERAGRGMSRHEERGRALRERECRATLRTRRCATGDADARGGRANEDNDRRLVG